MFIRKCVKCGNDVEVQSKLATRVTCTSCKEKIGLVLTQRDYDTNDFIYCRKCNKVKRSLISHIQTEHKMTIEQYLKEFPEAPIIAKSTTIKKRSRSIESRAKTSVILKAVWKREDYRVKQMKKYNKPRKIGWKLTIENKEHIKQGQNSSVKMQARRERAQQRKQEKKDKIKNDKECLKEFVVCPLCLREGKDEIDARCKFLTFKHLQVHEYSLEKFKNEFPTFEFKTKSLCSEHSNSLSGERHFNYKRS